MTDGFASLDAHIERISALPELARNAATDVAEVVETSLVTSIRMGQSPSGERWQERKDGARALDGAEKSLAVIVNGSRIVATITAHIARHHKGRARGGIVRTVLPIAGIPDGMSRQIGAALNEAFARHMGGG